MLTSSLVTAGQYILAIGGYMESFSVLVFGRIIQGLGGEIFLMIQALYTVKWFHD